jgi:hypothetical protein
MSGALILPPHRLLGPVRAETIADEERRLGAALPPSLRRFLEKHNGGWFYSTMVRLYSVGDEEYRLSEENEDFREDVADWARDRIIFASDGGAGVYYYDVGARTPGGECPLYYWTWEERRGEPVGGTFDDFLLYLGALAPRRFGLGAGQ